MQFSLFCGRTMVALFGLAAWFSADLQAANPKYFIVLAGQPLVKIGAPTGREAAPAAAERLAPMNREQDSWSAVIQGRGGRVLERYHLLNHALFVELPAAEAEALRGQPGIAAVVPERHYYRQLIKSVPYVGATRVWSGTNSTPSATGKGVRIGIIDSGIDYHHAMFGGSGSVADYSADDSTLIEPGSFPTAKVVGGTDFVGDDYDSGSDGPAATPVPDPDPLDPALNGHGSHVAGIAAGFGVLDDDSTFRGPYNRTFDPQQFKIGPGVAPEAVLYALKVFGSSGSTSSGVIVKALNWAADPNGDNDTSDHLDVVNLSLGSDFSSDDPGDPEQDAVDRLMALGCVVTVSAGNGGDVAYKVGHPSTAPRVICVANCVSDGVSTTGGIRVETPAVVARNYEAEEGMFTKSLSSLGPIRAPVVIALPLLGCAPISNEAALLGNIALIDRGTCFFSDKVRHAQTAGAIGVIIVNNMDGPPFPMSGTGDTSDISIPAMMITKADGGILRAQASKGLEITMDAGLVVPHPELADTIEDFSSRGPVWRHSALKPDIAAPGASIRSTRAGSGSDGLVESGTSMSAPHIAGAAALVKQVHPDWPAEEIKAVLMNTAVTPLRSVNGAPYSESRAGAGRVAVDRAVRSPVTVRAEKDGGAVSLSFGEILASEPVTREAAVILSNHSHQAFTYRIASSNTLDNPGVRLIPANSELVVPAKSTARVAVKLEINPALLKADADHSSEDTLGGSPRFALPEGTGELWFFGGPVDLHVPWYSVPRALTTHLATTRSEGIPGGDTVSVLLPTRRAVGTSLGHPRPLVGIFELGATNSVNHFGDYRDATDLIATGAASDFSTAHTLAETRVFFALVTAAAWPTPQRYFQNLEIEVDRNGDGIADVVLANNNQGSTDANNLEDYEDANDALLTAINNNGRGPLGTGGVWNGLAPNVADTAPFQNAMMVHSATGAQLGLTNMTPSFRYRAVTHGDFSDETPWVRFDPTRPIIDATGSGIQHTPWLDEGAKVAALLSRPNAVAAGISATGEVSVLLVHAQGQPGAQSEVVVLNLATNDLDADGLPDDWELSLLGDLHDEAASDRDGDGFTTGQEYAAGTDPTNPQSLLMLTSPTKLSDPIQWQSVIDKHYSVLRSDTVNGTYLVWRTGITATEVKTSVIDPDLAGRPQAYFYRIRLDP